MKTPKSLPKAIYISSDFRSEAEAKTQGSGRGSPLFPAAWTLWPVNKWASPTPGSTDGAPVLPVPFCGIQIGYALRKTNLEGSRDDGT